MPYLPMTCSGKTIKVGHGQEQGFPGFVNILKNYEYVLVISVYSQDGSRLFLLEKYEHTGGEKLLDFKIPNVGG